MMMNLIKLKKLVPLNFFKKKNNDTINIPMTGGNCPVNCRYCAVTNIEKRRCLWEKNPLIGINKAVTYINPPYKDQWVVTRPDVKQALRPFYKLDPNLFTGDIVCFNAVSDPFWKLYRDELEFFLKRYSPVAKLVTCVTKMPVPSVLMKHVLSKYPNFRLIVSITGLDGIEGTSTESRLKTLARAKEYGIKAFPLCHPYISGMSDLSFLKPLKELGYDEIDVKGFRYNPRFDGWMNKKSIELYRGSNEDEVLIEDGWREKVIESGLKIVSLKDWYKMQNLTTPKLTREEAELKVREVMKIANITSSGTDEEVFESSVQRRL